MNLTDDVLNDLLTLYLAGEASADTRALIDERIRREPAFAAKVAAARAVDLGSAVPAGRARDRELEALTRTRHAIRLRTIFWASALFFTVLPLSFRGGDAGVEFVFLGRQPGVVWAFWSIAAAAWIACFVMHREVSRTGL
jgi:hypothetical protein